MALLLGLYRADMAERLKASRQMFRRPVVTVDIHTHSNYSDGRGTVAENYEAFQNAGLDFLFATDHRSIGQKRITAKYDNASWGQEPGAGLHHLGLLLNTRTLNPRADSVRADLDRARKLAPFAWIPHPTGWYPSRLYSDEAIESLWTLGESFAMEVMNGANKIVSAYDQFDERTVAVWDRLLCDGRKVTGVGGSDAHGPDEIGTVWTGVMAREATAEAIVDALAAGNCFASEASLLAFTCERRPMGATVTRKKGSTVTLRFRVADAQGLASARVVSGGKAIREIQGKGRTVVEGELTRKVGAGKTYYRLESIAADQRRAFSTPIYIEPKP